MLGSKGTLAALAVLGLLGILLVLWATPLGIGLDPDTACYFWAAQSLAAGKGLTEFGSSVIPLTWYPPLYSVVLSIPTFFRSDTAEAARWLNALIFGINIYLAGFAVRRAGGSSIASLFCAAFVLVSSDQLDIHAQAMSEALFISWTLLGLLLLESYAASLNLGVLVASACIAALGYLTRYAGLALVVLGAATPLLAEGRLDRKLGRSLLFGLVCGLPIWLWSTRGLPREGAVFHPGALADGWASLRFAVSRWPFNGDSPIGVGAAASLVAALIAAVIILARKTEPRPRRMELLAPFVGAYLAMIAFTLCLFDAAANDPRYLLPIQIILLVWISRRLSSARTPVIKGRVLVAVAALVLAVHGKGAAAYLESRRGSGWGFARPAWRDSETMRAVRALEPDIAVYTNAPDAVYLLAGRKAHVIPRWFIASKDEENPAFLAQLREMQSELEGGRARLVFFDLVTWRRRLYLPTAKEIGEIMPIRQLHKLSDGEIFDIPKVVSGVKAGGLAEGAGARRPTRAP